jgi:hypothetical protein
MYTLGPEEKTTVVMVYTQTGLIRGEVVTRQGVRVSTWLRTEGAPDYICLHNLQWIQFSGGAIKTVAYSEVVLPTALVIGFHLAPPVHEPLDYDEREANRVNKPLTALMGMFIVEGKIRISAQTDIATSLNTSHTQWISIYEAEICAGQLPQMPPIQVPMMLIRPTQVGFILQD